MYEIEVKCDYVVKTEYILVRSDPFSNDNYLCHWRRLYKAVESWS